MAAAAPLLCGLCGAPAASRSAARSFEINLGQFAREERRLMAACATTSRPTGANSNCHSLGAARITGGQGMRGPEQPTLAQPRSWGRPSRQQLTTCGALAAAGGGEDQTAAIGTAGASLPALCQALYKFSRPHTMIGTAISVSSISALAVQGVQGLTAGAALTGLVQALAAALLMNVCIVGINQLYDIDIDKVNKPYLPLASGELTPRAGAAIVVGTGAASLALGSASGSLPLMATLVVSLALGILYSIELPFMRWKRSPVLAAGCILVVRALAVQLGFYHHMRTAIGLPLALTEPLAPAVAFTVSFMLLFSVVIALFKDIPDAQGDDRAGVRTLTVQLGPERVFWACIWILSAAYAGAIAYSVTAAVTAVGSAGALLSSGALLARTAACVGGHALMAALLWRRAGQVDLRRRQAITDCYMYVWKLFYAEYLLIPLLL